MSVERQIGNCQACAGDFKLRAGVMVHHGYERPGIGYDIGDCLGVGQVPYEVSCELVKERKRGLEMYRDEQQSLLQSLERNAVRLIAQKEYRHGREADRVNPGQVDILPPIKGREYLVTYDRDQTPDKEWNLILKNKKYSVKSNIRAADADIDFLAQRIDNWHPMPIRTVEEEEQKEARAKAERGAAKAAAKAEKEAKAAAKEAEKDRKVLEKMKKHSRAINALKAELRRLADEFNATSSRDRKIELAQLASAAVGGVVGYSEDALIGPSAKPIVLRLLDMPEEMLLLRLISMRPTMRGAEPKIDYSYGGHIWEIK